MVARNPLVMISGRVRELPSGDTVTGASGGSGPWTLVNKVSDESRTSNATLADDSALIFPMAANSKYTFRGTIFFDTGASGDFKWRHSGPASPTLVRLVRQWIIPGGTAFAGIAVDQAYSSADLALTGTGTNGGVVWIEGIIQNGVNAGNFAFRWAQNTSDAVSTIVRAGSYLEWALVQ